MNNLNVVVALITSDNDYQAEQAASATEAAARLGLRIQVVYADNDAVNQTQQLIKIIQNTTLRTDAIIVEPVGTEMIQVAKAAVAAGIGWGLLNRESEHISELRRGRRAPVFAVTTDQIEVGSIQARQFAALVEQGNILYIEGPSGGGVSSLRTKGMLSAKPAGLALKVLKGDWTERSGHHAIKSWLSLSTSRKLDIRLVGVPERCHGNGRTQSICGVVGHPGTRALAENAVHRLRRCNQDRPGVGAPGTVSRNRSHASHCGPGPRNTGQGGPDRFRPTHIHSQRALVVSET